MKQSRLELSQVFLVLKRSKWERDLQRYGSADTAKKIYYRQNQSLDRILSSHERQLANIALLRRELRGGRFLYQEELPFIKKEDFYILASVGGDNHFVHVGHFAAERPLLGINSDPLTSTGALLSFHPLKAIEMIQSLLLSKDWMQELSTQRWSRIEAQISYPDGQEQTTEACISEISVRSRFHDYISRYLIRLRPDNQKQNTTAKPASFEEHKCSGLLLATGAGSTGWYRNCHPADMQDTILFSKEAPFFRGVAREPSPQLKQNGRCIYPEVRSGESLEIISEMDGEITIDADPRRVYDFPPGAIASFRLAPSRLLVISSSQAVPAQTAPDAS